MTEIKHLTDADFKDALKGKLALIDFFAEWCGPCRIQSKTLESVAAEADASVLIAKVDVDAAQETAASLGIFSIPTIALFKDGEKVYLNAGVHGKDQLLELLGKFA